MVLIDEYHRLLKNIAESKETINILRKQFQIRQQVYLTNNGARHDYLRFE